MKKGFTLIELMMVVAIISLLAVSVFVALNPSKRLKDTKDARRTSDVDTVLTAIHQYIVDNKGALPAGLSTSMAITMIGAPPGNNVCNVTPGTYCGTVPAQCVDLTTPLATYLKSLPIDPNGSTGSPAYTSSKTGYAVTVDANNIITITACNAENNPVSESR